MTMPDFESKVAILVDKYDLSKSEFNKATYRVFVQGAEPSAVIDPSKMFEIADNFDLILTWNDEILKRYPDKTVFFPFGTCWIPKEQQAVHQKSKMISIIASEKRFLEGHKLRHEIVDRFKDRMDVYGRAYKYVESKTEALNDYMFTVVIENVKENNYFSEKMIDCLRTGTVPIHWGTPNIADFFNPKGFIFINSADEMGTVMETLNKEKYDSLMPFIQENFEKAAKYAEGYADRIYKEVETFIQKNPRKNKSFLSRLFNQ